MGALYEAVFSPTHLGLKQIWDRFRLISTEFGIALPLEIFRIEVKGGRPTVLAQSGHSVSSIEDVPQIAISWMGFSLFTYWQGVGEVEIWFFKSQSGRLAMRYTEERNTYFKRTREVELGNQLYRFLLRVCSDLDMDICIYELEDVYFELPSVERVKERLNFWCSFYDCSFYRR